MAQDLWSKPDDNNNNLGAGWDGSQLTQQNNGGYPGNGWQPGNNYSQNSYQQNGYQQNGWQPQNGYGYPNAAPPVEQNDVFGQSAAAESLSTYIGKTFLWMFGGLLVTALVALGMIQTGMTFSMLYRGGTAALIGVTIAELAVVIFMTARVRKLSPAGAAACFLIYAALTGVTFSMYFYLYSLDILIVAFGATALFFGGMAAASLIFKMELSGIRPYLFGGLIFLIVFGILSLIFNLGAFNTLICYVGIAVFLAYTAYDTAKIRQNYYYYQGRGDLLKKASIFSALELYLDFINLFLYILRLLGRNRK